MRSVNRAAIVGVVVVAMAAALGAGYAGGKRHAEPPAAKVAVCDIYKIADKLIDSDRFKPLIKAEGDRIAKDLEPMETELKGLQEKLQGANPQDPEAQKTAQEFQAKRQAYMQARQKAEQDGQAFVAGKYVEAYNLVKASVEAVSKEQGYTHVIASRGKDEKIAADNPQRVIDAVLARPVLVSPEGSDITEDVIKDLKL